MLNLSAKQLRGFLKRQRRDVIPGCASSLCSLQLQLLYSRLELCRLRCYLAAQSVSLSVQMEYLHPPGSSVARVHRVYCAQHAGEQNRRGRVVSKRRPASSVQYSEAASPSTPPKSDDDGSVAGAM